MRVLFLFARYVLVLIAAWSFIAWAAREALAQAGRSAAPIPSTREEYSPSPSMLNLVTKVPSSLTFFSNGETLATISATGDATLCGKKVPESEVWRHFEVINAASRIGRGKAWCAWYLKKK